MTTSSISQTSAKAAKGSMLGILGSLGTDVSVPSEPTPTDNPSFLPMLLQLLMGQKGAVPVTVKGGKQNAESQKQNSGDPAATANGPVITVLTDGVDGLTRLTLEKTPASLRTLTRALSARAEDADGVTVPSLTQVVTKRRKDQMEEEEKKKGGNIGTTGAILDGTGTTHSEPAGLSIPTNAGDTPPVISAETVTAIPVVPAAETTAAPAADTAAQAPAPFFRIVSAESLTLPSKEKTGKAEIPAVALPPANGKEQDGTTPAPALPDPTHPVTRSAESAAVPQEAIPVQTPKAPMPAGDDVWKNVAAMAADIERTAAASADLPIDPLSASQRMAEVRSAVPEASLTTERPRTNSARSDARPVKEGKKNEKTHPLFRDAVVSMTGKEPTEKSAPAPTETTASDERPAADRPVIAKQEELSGGPLKRNEEKDFARAIAEAGPVKGKETGDVKQVHGPAPTSALDRAESVKNIMEQLSRSVSVAVKEGHSEMKVVLHPDTLGEVTVRVQVEEGKVTAKLDVQQPQVKNTIEANIPQLKEALTARGLTMEHIEISTAQNGLADGAAKNRQNGQKQKHHGSVDAIEEEQEAVKYFGYNTVEYTV